MPVRSLNSSVIRWPDAQEVERALRRWAKDAARRQADVIQIGYFGSYARGDWGVGSDLDLIIILSDTDRPFTQRSSEWDMVDIPVPTDVLVYTAEEWRSMSRQRYGITKQKVNWIYRR